MPFSRPTLTSLRSLVANFISSNLPGSDALLRFSTLNIVGRALATLGNLHYGYLDYIALQAVPWTATDEYLDGWAATKSVFRIAAQNADDGQFTFPCTGTPTIPAGSTVVRTGDSVQYLTTADATGSGGYVVCNASAVPDPTGLTGAFGDCDIGTLVTLGSAVAGVQSSGTVTTAFTDGSDVETDDDLNSRMMAAFQTPPGVGTAGQYVTWARQLSQVTRAWCVPHAMGSGTIAVYTMWDVVESAFNGFPQGTDGVATNETRDAVATGDQLIVANYLYGRQGCTPLVYSLAPNADTINFTIHGISGASTATQNAIEAALDDVFIRNATAEGGTINIDDFYTAVASVPLTEGFTITAPTVNHTSVVGDLPVCGTVSYT